MQDFDRSARTGDEEALNYIPDFRFTPLYDIMPLCYQEIRMP